MYRSIWARDKRLLATRLAKGAPASGYSDAVLILSATISGFASDVWKGEGRDHARFAQVMKEFLPPELKIDHISVPLLLGALDKRQLASKGVHDLVSKAEAFGESRILTGSDIDVPEAHAVATCPEISLNVLRQHSYASLLYRELRCAYSHEYRSGPNASEYPMTSVTTEPVSYVNRVGHPTRQIHFHLEWLGDVVEALAKGLDRAAETFPRKDPGAWWVHGDRPRPKRTPHARRRT
jgi:hypothetical protein